MVAVGYIMMGAGAVTLAVKVLTDLGIIPVIHG